MTQWQEIKLKELVTFKTGKLDSNAMDEAGIYPFFTCAPETYKINSYAFDTSAILLAGNNAAGIFPLKFYSGKFNCYQRTYVIENIDKNFSDLRFIFYSIKIQLDFLRNISIGATTKFLTMRMLENLKINMPPISTQKKISSLLMNYDDLIEKNNIRINLLEESIKLTYEEWFLRFRINGIKLAINQTTKLPLEWKIKSITNFDSFKYDVQKVKKFEGKKIYYATADIDGTSISGNGEEITWSNKPSRAQIQPSNNSVWFARMSDTFKVLCFNSKNLELQEKIILSSGFAGFKAKNELCLPFLYCLIKSKFFYDIKDLYATGATQVSLNNDSMNFIKIVEPEMQLIEKFGAETLPILEEIAVLKNKNRILEEARDILLPRFMTSILDIEKIGIAV